MLSAQQLLQCQILRGVARVLELSTVTATTAFTFLHRVQLSQQQQQQRGCDLPNQELVCACIYLAAKVEEVHVSTNQLINTARVLSDATQQHLLQALAPLQQQQQQQLGSLQADVTSAGNSTSHGAAAGQRHASPAAAAATAAAAQHQASSHPPAQPAPPPAAAAATPTPAAGANSSARSPEQQQQQPGGQHRPQQQQQPPAASREIVVGDEYYAAKEQLFVAEQVILRLLRFQLVVTHPHKHLLNFCKVLGVKQEQAAAAVCALNDAVAYTALVCRFEAAVVAAAALQYVLLRAQQQQDQQQQEQEQQQRGRYDDVAPSTSRPHGGGGGSRRGGSGSSSSRREYGSDDVGIQDFLRGSTQAASATDGWVELVGLETGVVADAVQELEGLYSACKPVD